jgi:DNA replication protein DnaC
LSTVITTNYELEEIEPRIRSRLTDTDFCRIVSIRASDFRQRSSPAATSGRGRSNLQFYDNMTFDSFNMVYEGLNATARDSLQRAHNKALRYAKQPNDFIVFTGDYGCGKTHLAAAVANYIEQHEHTLFLTVPDLLDHLRSAFGPSSGITFDRRFEEARTIRYLILDDLGTENATPWAREKLFQIVDYRYIARLPTIITAHFEAKIDDRIKVRIKDKGRSEVVEIHAPNYRFSEKRSFEKLDSEHNTQKRKPSRQNRL